MRDKVNYRKIYEEHYGPIPKEDDCGRPYHVHHIDGNRRNNNITNLQLVTAQEHYDIHYRQGVWAAAARLLSHLTESRDELSKAATVMNHMRVKDGTHPFIGGKLQAQRIADVTHNFVTEQGRKTSRTTQLRLLSEGQHAFQKLTNGEPLYKIAGRKGLESQLVNGTHISCRPELLSIKAKQRFHNGTHNFIGMNEARIEAGTHNFQQRWKCEHCAKEGKNLALYHRWHGDRCKHKGNQQ
jgi:hypothetical protein